MKRVGPVELGEAWEIFRGTLKPVGCQWVALDRCHGRVLGRDIACPWDLPPQDVATVDGYAISAEDVFAGCAMRVVGEARLDRPWEPCIGPGQAVRVVTGAPLPAGTNAVLPAEEANVGEDGLLRSPIRISAWANVARTGALGKQGQLLLRAGETLGPEQVAILASVGAKKVLVKRRPTVRLVLTGSELLPPGTERREGRIFASHGLYLRSLVEACGGRAVIEGPVPDDAAWIAESLRKGHKEQLLITTGGTGKGRGDLIYEAMARLGATVLFEGLKVRPGASIALFQANGGPVLALPGGIGGLQVGCECFVRPGLMYLLGQEGWKAGGIDCVVVEDLIRDPEASRFIEARVWAERGQLYAAPLPRWPRGLGLPSARSEGWIEVPPGKGDIRKGGLVRVRLKAFNWVNLEVSQESQSSLEGP